MDRGEPTFVPEWYKGASAGSSSSSNLNHDSRPSSHSDEHGTGLLSRNRLSLSLCDHEAPRSFRRSTSSNGSVSYDKDNSSRSRIYSNFNRSHRDKDREKDLDLRDRGRPRLLDNGVRTEKDTLRHSSSMISGRHVESWPKGPGNDLSNGGHSAGRTIGGIGKVSFESDFPSLGAAEKQGLSDVSRIPSPGLSSAIQNLHIGSSVMLRGDGWTSALVVPPTKVGGNGSVLTSASQTATVNLASTALSTTTGLNMAEALTQAPPRARNAPQLTVDAQRIQELTRIQYSKLIPVTPSAPKSSVINPSDKSKFKVAKNGDSSISVKIGQQQSIHAGSFQALRAPAARPDGPKMSQTGNFQVLNRERNVVSPPTKDGPNLTNASIGVTPAIGVPSAIVTPIKSPSINPKVKADSTGGALTSAQSPFGEKGPLSQTQKRNDFFNSLRKKAAMNQPAVIPKPSSVASLSNSEKLNLQNSGVSSDNLEKENHESSSGKDVSEDSDSHEECARFVSDNVGEPNESFCSEDDDFCLEEPNEKEVAFMESLGWDKNAGVAALTDEEIADFNKKYGKLKPSSKLDHSELQPF